MSDEARAGEAAFDAWAPRNYDTRALDKRAFLAGFTAGIDHERNRYEGVPPKALSLREERLVREAVETERSQP